MAQCLDIGLPLHILETVHPVTPVRPTLAPMHASKHVAAVKASKAWWHAVAIKAIKSCPRGSGLR
jgi:hypothetical protein